jgi:hypothetical protein
MRLDRVLLCALLVSVDGGISRQSAEPGPDASTLQPALAKLEYRPSPRREGLGLSAPNRAQGLRLTFTDEGLAIEERESGAPLLALGLTHFGRAGLQRALGRAPMRASGDSRVERSWEALTEWFVNEPRGVEHGWTVTQKAPGDGPLVLSVTVSGATTETSGNEVLFESESGRLLRYGGLKAFDAAGTALAARMSTFPNGFRIEVDDANARYPIIVDPLLTVPAWTAEGNQVGAEFGNVTGAGDVNGDGYSDVLVGAPYFDNGQVDEGRAFLYLGGASGLSATPVWTAEVNQASAEFGSVAGVGDVNGDGYSDVVVGARRFDNGETDEGRAYLYLGSAGGLSVTPAWTAEGNQAGAIFGGPSGLGDVNGDGFDDVGVSADNYDNGETNEGRLFVFLGSSSGLSPTAAWTGEANQAAANLGPAASAGDVNGDGYGDIVVAAPNFSNGEGGEGRAYLYLGSASGLGTLPAWSAEANQAGARFGGSVAGAGDVNGDGYSDVVVSAGHLNGFSGATFLYLGSVTGLGTTAAWTASTNRGGDAFGEGVSSAGDVNGDGYSDVVVGARGVDGFPFNQQGEVYLHLGSASGLSTGPAWSFPSNQDFAALGGVAGVGDVNGDGFSDVVVSAALFDNGQTDEGRTFLFLGSASGLTAASAWSAESNQANASLGIAVASAGDVNGDGFSDVAVGAPAFDNGEVDEGSVFVFLGSTSGLSPTPFWTAESNQAGASLGIAVASAGDVNGDGFSDLVVGAARFDNGEADEGRAFVYLGSATGLDVFVPWTAETNQASSLFGTSVATAGDVNGDGFSDIVVGAAQFDNGEADEGGAYLYLGSSTGLSLVPAWTAEGNQSGASLGASVASAGDVNGDGYSDVVLGSPSFDSSGRIDEGRAFVYLGGSNGLAATPVWTASSNQASASFGTSVASAGDVNGDGFSDVVVGAPSFDNGQTDEGRAFVFLGTASGLTPAPVWTVESEQVAAGLGQSVSAAGDVNGDGFSDVVVGAPSFDDGQTDEGRAYVFGGAASGLSPGPMWTVESEQVGAGLGGSVAMAGDVNGDGFSDVVLGASSFDNGQANEGRAWLYLGGDDAPGLPRGLTQSLAGSTPGGRVVRGVAPVSLASDGFNSLVNQGLVVLETEVKPLGTRFDGSALVRSTPGLARQRKTVTWPNLQPGRYHWRARLVSGYDRGRWVAYGANSEAEADFTVITLSADAGALDAGATLDAGAVDAGETDGGTLAADAGLGTRRYSVGCGCLGGPRFPIVFLALLLWRASRRAGVRH